MVHDFESFRIEVSKIIGIDLTSYKSPQMERRINNLMRRLSIPTFADFLHLIASDPSKRKQFVDYITINVTEFFRGADKFTELSQRYLPMLLQQKPRLRIWSAGCSTGAEPYTLALMLQELTPDKSHEILATDIDVEMLAKAKLAQYNTNELRAVPPTTMKKYFTQTNETTWKLSEQITKRVTFKQHNLLVDPFERDFDLITCRNVVIYFTEEAKDKLYNHFAASLRVGGLLFVGGTECIFNHRQLGFKSPSPFFYEKTSE